MEQPMNDAKSPAYSPECNGYGPIGITKREYYAALVMNGLLCASNWSNVPDLAYRSFQIADAMIAESNKGEKK